MPPITAPDLIMQLEPILEFSIVVLDLIIVFSNIITLGPIEQPDSIITLL